jgi:hypothetical protein
MRTAVGTFYLVVLRLRGFFSLVLSLDSLRLELSLRFLFDWLFPALADCGFAFLGFRFLTTSEEELLDDEEEEEELASSLA